MNDNYIDMDDSTLRQRAEHAAARARIARNDEVIAALNVLWAEVHRAWRSANAAGASGNVLEAHRLACEALAGQINALRAENREHVRTIYGGMDIDC